MNRCFPAIRVINLDRAAERWETVSEHLSALGCAFERVRAVNGKKLPMSFIRRVTTLQGSLFCSRAMIGCFCSHRKVWRRGPALILEDDVRFALDAVSQVETAMLELPSDWDIFVLGSFTSSHHEIAWPEKLLAMTLRTKPDCLPYSHLLVRPSMLIGLHAYAVSDSGAKKLLACVPRMSEHLDWSITREIAAKRLDVYAMKSVAFQDGSTGTICGSVPFLLNLVAHSFSIKDGRTLGWMLSEPLFVFMHDSVAINYWCVLFLLTGFILNQSVFHWICFLCIDFLVLRIHGPHSCLSYLMPTLAFAVGQVVHACIRKVISA